MRWQNIMMVGRTGAKHDMNGHNPRDTLARGCLIIPSTRVAADGEATYAYSALPRHRLQLPPNPYNELWQLLEVVHTGLSCSKCCFYPGSHPMPCTVTPLPSSHRAVSLSRSNMLLQLSRRGRQVSESRVCINFCAGDRDTYSYPLPQLPTA